MTRGQKSIKPIPEFSDEFKMRFFANIPSKSPSECWEWMGHVTNNGYGVIKNKQVAFLAHRIALYFDRVPSSQTLCACHSCDNPLCCNPAHLFWGTHRENMIDMNNKNRANRPRGDAHHSRLRPETRPRGERHALAKLTENQVFLIRKLSAAGQVQRVIAAKFGVTRETVSSIIQGRIWRHLDAREKAMPKLILDKPQPLQDNEE